MLAPRDEPLARLEAWLASKLDAIAASAVRAPVEQFATWHHLRRLRRNSAPNQASDAPTRSAKQEITETIKFLTWLDEHHHRTAATCLQHDLQEWLATGPTTRTEVRSFVAWANKTKLNTAIHLDVRQPQSTRLITQDQRLAWINELLTGDVQTLAYRVAGTLLLLYAQPLVRIAALKTTAVDATHDEILITLGAQPIPVPHPFAGMLERPPPQPTQPANRRRHRRQPMAFPRAQSRKTHLHPHSMLRKLHHRGINVLGARNCALQNLVAEIPPPVVAHLLGYSHHCTHHHAQLAAQPWSRYVTQQSKQPAHH